MLEIFPETCGHMLHDCLGTGSGDFGLFVVNYLILRLHPNII